MQDATLQASDISLKHVFSHLIEQNFHYKSESVGAHLNEMPLMQVSKQLTEEDADWIQDRESVQLDDKRTQRLRIWKTNAAGVPVDDWRLIVNWPEWFDTRDEKFGSGAVELTMHLMKFDFKSAVELLSKQLHAISDFSLEQLRHHLIEEDFSFRRDGRSEHKIYRVSKLNGDDWRLIVNWPEWFDTRDEKFGSGAVELTMHLMKFDFNSAVELLSKTPAPAAW